MNLLSDGRVLVAGGSTPTGANLPTAEVFTPATGAWTATGAMSTSRNVAASVVLADGRVLVAAGRGPDNIYLDSAELYTPCGAGENAPPVALCSDRVVNAGPTCSASASIDDGSYDPDGRPEPLALTQAPAAPYGLGDHLVTLTASDGAATASCQATVTVVDDTPPVAGASRGLVLWPPNHQLRFVSLCECAEDATDNCGGTLPLAGHAQITHVTSDEPGCHDIELVGPTAVKLRAERDGSSDGRVYTLHYTATDPSGNSTAASCTVSIPHDRSGAPAVDSGPRTCVGQGC